MAGDSDERVGGGCRPRLLPPQFWNPFRPGNENQICVWGVVSVVVGVCVVNPNRGDGGCRSRSGHPQFRFSYLIQNGFRNLRGWVAATRSIFFALHQLSAFSFYFIFCFHIYFNLGIKVLTMWTIKDKYDKKISN